MCIRDSPIATVDIIGQCLFYWLDILLVEEGVTEVVLHSFERLCFREYCSNHSIISHIFEALVQCGTDDPVGMDPWSFEQEIVRRVNINSVVCYF